MLLEYVAGTEMADVGHAGVEEKLVRARDFRLKLFSAASHGIAALNFSLSAAMFATD